MNKRRRKNDQPQEHLALPFISSSSPHLAPFFFFFSFLFFSSLPPFIRPLPAFTIPISRTLIIKKRKRKKNNHLYLSLSSLAKNFVFFDWSHRIALYSSKYIVKIDRYYIMILQSPVLPPSVTLTIRCDTIIPVPCLLA